MPKLKQKVDPDTILTKEEIRMIDEALKRHARGELETLEDIARARAESR